MTSHLKRSIISFGNLANAQEEKGIDKYGKPLDPMDDYDWLKMCEEEIVDAFKYLEAEKVKRGYIVNEIRKIIKFSCSYSVQKEIGSLLDEML